VEEVRMTEQRFLTLGDVAETLNISASQTYALVRSGELCAIKVGGRGQWRVERAQLETYIRRMYEQTRRFVANHPYADVSDVAHDGADTVSASGW
jgi:excisionase family DNA binding protein